MQNLRWTTRTIFFLTLFSVLAGYAEAGLPRENGRIYFIEQLDVTAGPESNIYSIDAGGGGKRVEFTGVDLQVGFETPSFDISSDGKKIVFSRNSQLVLASLEDTSEPSKPLVQGFKPSFHPNGQSIAYIFEDQVHSINLDGSNPVLLLSGPTQWVWASWSPSGCELAVTSFVPLRGVEVGIFRPGNSVESIFGPSNDTGLRPRWSPDGSQILTFGFIHNAAGGESFQLPQFEFQDRSLEGVSGPDWSPDGQRLVGRVNLGLPMGRVTQGIIFSLSPVGTGHVPLYTSADRARIFFTNWAPVPNSNSGPAEVCSEASWLVSPGNPDGLSSRFDGLAFANFSSASAGLELELIPQTAPDAGGQPAGADNRAVLQLEAGEQKASLRRVLFGSDPTVPAWIELTGDLSRVGAFFQYGTDELSQLDGGVAIQETSEQLLFTRAFDGRDVFRDHDATTRLSLFNPNLEPVSLTLTYLPESATSAQGQLQVARELSARSLLDEKVSEIFGSPLAGGRVTVEVTAGSGIVGVEVIQLTDQTTVLGLHAALDNPTNRAFSAHLVHFPGVLFTDVNVINTAASPRNVTLRAIKRDGSIQGSPVEILMNPGGHFSEDAGSLFAGQGPAGAGESFEGSLVLEADGPGVVGDVIFGESGSLRYAAALPLQTEAVSEALFNQVANIPGQFFTGLAFFNPNLPSPQGSESVEITVQVFQPDGTMVGETAEPMVLGPGERMSELMSTLVPASAQQAGGYVRVSANQAIIAQMIFGALKNGVITLFSAVPPTVIQ